MKFIKFLIKWSVVIIIWLTILCALILLYYFTTLPSLEELEQKNSKQIISIQYSNQSEIISLGTQTKNQVEYFELPDHLIKAVIATEDRRFFEHHGIDFIGVLRASYSNFRSKKISEGGSTITQQLVKLKYLDSQKTFNRKIQEILLAWQLENKLTKEQILTSYFNAAYFGSGNYGIASAAKFYFNKEVSDLNLQESAMLVGLLKAPSKLSPKNNPKLTKIRTSQVIKNMFEAGFLEDLDDAEILSAQKLDYESNKEQKLYFIDYVYSQFPDFLSAKNRSIQKIYINTTFDEEIQNKLENAFDDFVKTNEKTLGKSQIAAIVMNKEGAILGLIGGKNYRHSQFNRAIYAKRQAGSVFKSFVYLQAFEEGFSPQDQFEDKKINISNWVPENYKEQYFGNVSLSFAFANSLNSVAVQLTQKINKEKLVRMIRKLGITSEISQRDLTIALGSSEVNLLELTSSYAAIANDGTPVIPYAISKITDEKNNILFQRKSSKFAKAFSAESAAKIKELLREVVENGTGEKADIANNIYGKTGTSQNYQDAWFVGFNDDFVIGIWIGNDDNSPTDKITGGSLPAELFGEIMKKLD